MTRKSEETRAKILDAALALFLERGYEAATMRAIADRARVALGNAYYYFESKEHLVQAFYARTQAEHVAASQRVLSEAKSLEGRLRGVLHAKIDTVDPYHSLAGALFRMAADPGSPLSPLSPESAGTRDEAVAIFTRVVDESDVTTDLRGELPRLLWLYHLGVLLFWIHDRSPGRKRTRRLIDGTASLLASAVGIAGNPLLRPLRRRALRLVQELEQ